jgi:hypothetical protein
MHVELSNTSEFALSFQEMLFFGLKNLENVFQCTHVDIKKINIELTESEKCWFR